MANNVLILGHSGRLGKTLLGIYSGAVVLDSVEAHNAKQENRTVDYFRLAAALIQSSRPGLVINCLGYTNVDKAESEPGEAMLLNAHGPELLAQACARAGAGLVHFSTDFVFDGCLGRPYREDDSPNPLSIYGKSKLAGENLVLETMPDALVIRGSWFFGLGQACFVDKIIAKAREGKPFKVVTDQVGSPTYTMDLAHGVDMLVQVGASGLVHLANHGSASRFELARAALELAGLDADLLQKATSADFPTPARRPAAAALDCSRYAKLTGEGPPPWREALARYLNRNIAD